MYDLFNPPPPSQQHSDTSRQAGESVSKSSEAMRRKVYDLIKDAGSWGHTDEEIQLALDMNPSTQRPRRVELVRMGLVKDSGRTRSTRSGRKATVWVEN